MLTQSLIVKWPLDLQNNLALIDRCDFIASYVCSQLCALYNNCSLEGVAELAELRAQLLFKPANQRSGVQEAGPMARS